MAWKLFGARGGEPKAQKNDKFAMATRQRRMFTAQMRVDSLPGFAKLKRQWCDPRTAFELDERCAALADGRTVRWAGPEPLAAALRSAAEVAPVGRAFAAVRDEPESRWVEAPTTELLAALATALPALRIGVTLLWDDRALVLDLAGSSGTGVDGALHGDWPAEFVAALSG